METHLVLPGRADACRSTSCSTASISAPARFILFVARTDDERRPVLATIGPVWDGNEVWLLAAGGTLYFAFPALYATGFSGFYLPLMMVLWLLILRGIVDRISQPR